MLVTSQTSFRWRKPATKDLGVTPRWSALRAMDRPLATPWGDGQPLTAGNLQVLWQQCREADAKLAFAFQRAAVVVGEDFSSPWSDLVPTDHQVGLPWNKSIKPVDIRCRLIYNPLPAEKDISLRARFRRSGELKTRLDPEQVVQASLYRPGEILTFLFGGKPYIPTSSPLVFFDFSYSAPSSGILPADSSIRTRWSDSRKLDQARRLRWGKARQADGGWTAIRYPDYTGPVVIITPPKEPELQEAYMIGNLVNVTEAVSNTPLLAKNIQLAFDKASFSWSLTMDIEGRASMNLIRPDESGIKQVRIIVNGHTWVFLVEKYRRNFKFAEETYSITGSSRTQLLTAPYARPRSGVNALDITAKQMMETLVMNTGFTIDWSTTQPEDVPDWVIPAGALSYKDQTPMQLIARFSQAIGAITSPGMDTDTITILPQYLVPVWEWSPLVAHKILPSALITNLGGEYVPNPTWNSCYVSGVNYGCGVLVRRNGTAGEVPTEDIFDDLMTDPTANQYRGKTEICKGGNQELVTIQLPLFSASNPDAPGLVTPGMLCDVREVDANWIGLCLSTQISCSGVGASAVTQTLKLERHVSEI